MNNNNSEGNNLEYPRQGYKGNGEMHDSGFDSKTTSTSGSVSGKDDKNSSHDTVVKQSLGKTYALEAIAEDEKEGNLNATDRSAEHAKALNEAYDARANEEILFDRENASPSKSEIIKINSQTLGDGAKGSDRGLKGTKDLEESFIITPAEIVKKTANKEINLTECERSLTSWARNKTVGYVDDWTLPFSLLLMVLIITTLFMSLAKPSFLHEITLACIILGILKKGLTATLLRIYAIFNILVVINDVVWFFLVGVNWQYRIGDPAAMSHIKNFTNWVTIISLLLNLAMAFVCTMLYSNFNAEIGKLYAKLGI